MSQNQNQKKEAVDSARKKRSFYFMNIVFLSVLTIVSLLFAVFTFIRARTKGTDGFRQLYTDSQIDRIRQDAALEERNAVLLQIQSSLESGKGTTRMLREVFEDSIVVMSGGKYLFFPIADDIERNPLAPDMLSQQDGIVRYQADSPAVKISQGVLLSDKNGRIDWDRLADSGISETMLTAGTISESGFSQDAQFERNCRKASEKGIPWSISLEISGPAGEEALSSALEWIRAAREEYGAPTPEDPDTEEEEPETAAEPGQDAEKTERETGRAASRILLRIQTREIRSEEGKEQGHWTKTVRNLCRMIEKEDLVPVIGAGMYTFAAQIDLPAVAEYDRWLVDHEESVIFPYSFSFWEFSSEGAMEGVPGSSILYGQVTAADELEIQ